MKYPSHLLATAACFFSSFSLYPMNEQLDETLFQQKSGKYAIVESQKYAFEMPPRYQPLDTNKLTTEDVVSLILEGDFVYDTNGLYLKTLTSALDTKTYVDFIIPECMFLCCEELIAHYTQVNNDLLRQNAEYLAQKFVIR